ncbi:MAG: hypothetical protein IH892_15210 [Planctomycetes bacterium]|nr:hypothetical protein [Planctomycetota bacterium]
MELVEGQTPAERLKRGSLATEETLETCQHIAEALEAAHAQGIIHRELSQTPGGFLFEVNARRVQERKFMRIIPHHTMSIPGATRRFTFLALVLFLSQLSTLPAVATPRPNVVIFLADDQGWGDLSVHGNKNLSTPLPLWNDVSRNGRGSDSTRFIPIMKNFCNKLNTKGL